MPVASTLVSTVLTYLPSVLLIALWAFALRGLRFSGWLSALVRLAGTMAHEALHLVVGWALGAKPVSLSLWPKRMGSHWVLGSVEFTNLDLFNAAPVAFAPLLLLAGSALVFEYWTVPALASGSYLNWALSGYVLATFLPASVPSTTDVKVGAVSGLLYLAAGYGLWHLR